jgi:hypothetical protein
VIEPLLVNEQFASQAQVNGISDSFIDILLYQSGNLKETNKFFNTQNFNNPKLYKSLH